MLSEIPKGKIFFRVIYYLPAVISGIIVMLMWKSFFDPTPDGVLNRIIGLLGFEAVDWFGNKNTAMIAIIIPSAWAGLGPGGLIYLAALKTVPSDLYEAAAIDGSGFFGRLWNITIPMIKPLILINLIFAFIGAFLSSEQMLVMTGGGPDGATTVVGPVTLGTSYTVKDNAGSTADVTGIEATASISLFTVGIQDLESTGKYYTLGVAKDLTSSVKVYAEGQMNDLDSGTDTQSWSLGAKYSF